MTSRRHTIISGGSGRSCPRLGTSRFSIGHGTVVCWLSELRGFALRSSGGGAYREINAMEQQLVHFGTVLLKFWLHIDPDEQLRRFRERQEDVHKQWKITDEDWRNRSKLDQYRDAVEEMLYRTSTPYAPWTIVESNCKWYARVKVLETVCEAIRQALALRES